MGCPAQSVRCEPLLRPYPRFDSADPKRVGLLALRHLRGHGACVEHDADLAVPCLCKRRGSPSAHVLRTCEGVDRGNFRTAEGKQFDAHGHGYSLRTASHLPQAAIYFYASGSCSNVHKRSITESVAAAGECRVDPAYPRRRRVFVLRPAPSQAQQCRCQLHGCSVRARGLVVR